MLLLYLRCHARCAVSSMQQLHSYSRGCVSVTESLDNMLWQQTSSLLRTAGRAEAGDAMDGHSGGRMTHLSHHWHSKHLSLQVEHAERSRSPKWLRQVKR